MCKVFCLVFVFVFGCVLVCNNVKYKQRLRIFFVVPGALRCVPGRWERSHLTVYFGHTPQGQQPGLLTVAYIL